MDMVSRLVQAGILPDCAVETVAWFRQQGNDAGLERYVNEVEEKVWSTRTSTRTRPSAMWAIAQ